METEARSRFTPAIILWIAWAVVLLGAYYHPWWTLIAGGQAKRRPFVGMVNPLLTLVKIGAVSLILAAICARFFRRPGMRTGFPSWRVIGWAGLFLALVLVLVLENLHLPGWGTLVRATAAMGMPAFGEAVPRALRGIVGCAAVLAASQVLGWAALRIASTPVLDRMESLLYRTATGLGMLSYLTLALATVHYYTVPALRLIVVALVLAGTALMGRTVLANRAPQEPDFAMDPGAIAGGDFTWKTITLFFLVIALTGALAPESGYDALWYHLQFPRMWLTHGTILDFPTEFHSLYPMTWELLYGAGLALGGPISAKLLHFCTLPLLALMVYQMTRRFLPDTPPWPAVTFLVSAPTILWEATTANVDLALTLHAGLALYALLRFAESESRPWLLLAALQVGLALATKHLGFFVLLPAATWLGIFLLRRRGLRQAVILVSLFTGVSLLIASPWYVRSWMATGNPVFPEFYGIFGAPPNRWDAISDTGLKSFLAHFGRPRTVLNFLMLPWDATVHAALYDGTIGPIFLLLLPALPLVPSTAPVFRLGFGVLTYMVLWALPIGSFQMRFLMPAVPPLAVLAGASYCRLISLLQTAQACLGGRMLKGGIALLVLLNVPPFMHLHKDRVGWLGKVMHRVPVDVVAGRVSADNYLASTVRPYAAWRYIGSHLPEDARILTFTAGDNYYSDRERLWAHTVVARPAVWGAPVGAEGQALQELLRLRITHIMFDKAELAKLPQGSVAVAGENFRQNWLSLEYEDRHIEFYRIRRDSPAPVTDK